jgi:hypothetical protein
MAMEKCGEISGNIICKNFKVSYMHTRYVKIPVGEGIGILADYWVGVLN